MRGQHRAGAEKHGPGASWKARSEGTDAMPPVRPYRVSPAWDQTLEKDPVWGTWVA